MKSRLRKQIFRLHKLLQVHIIDQSLLFTLQPDKRGLWLTRIPNVDTFDMSMTKLLKKLKRHTISSSIVTELFAESIELTFVEFSEMDQTTTSENVWKALRVYDPSLIALIYVEFIGPKIFTRFEVMSTGMTVGDIERIWRSNGHKEACKWLGHLVTRTFKHL